MVVVVLLLVGCPQPPPPACLVGEVQDADTEECVPEHCGADAWGLIERTGDTVHVAPWGDDDWDGSERWPYRSIQEGADEAGDAGGVLVAVAAGTYVENLELDDDHGGVEIAGRCAELVVIDGSGEEDWAVYVPGGEIRLRGVTVAGGTGGVLVERVGFGVAPELRLEGVLLEDNAWIGLGATGAPASANLEDVTIRDTQPLPDGTDGRGIDIEYGASLVARGLLLEGNHGIGLGAFSGAAADLEDATVRETQPLPDGTGGRGIEANSGASLIVQGLVLEGNHDVGLLVGNAGTTVDLEDATVRDTQPLPDETGGWGINVQEGASLIARGLLLERNHEVGLIALNAGTTVELEDVTIRDTQPLPDGTNGRGIDIEYGASLVACGLLLEGNHGIGLGAFFGAAADLEDVTVRETQPLPDGTGGTGIEVNSGASLIIQGLVLQGNHYVGLLAGHEGTIVDLEDATIRDSQSLPDGTFGRGVVVQDGASLVVRGLLLEGNHDVGLFASLGGTADLEDATIRDTQPLPSGTNGRGIGVQQGASLIARSLMLEENHEFGLFAAQAGTSVDLEDVQIVGTRTSVNNAGGFGIGVQDDASLTALGLQVEDSEGPGLYVVVGGTLEAWDAVLDRNGLAGAVVLDGRLALRGGTVSGSTFHPGEGGGIGVFGWDIWAPPDIELGDVAFSDLPGPALYLRGPGRYVMRGCDIQDTGTWPWQPGGVFAVEGVEPWHETDTGYFTGLLLEGNTFTDLSSDAILLDSSSATLDPHPETFAPNTFGNLDGVPLLWQRCDGIEAPEILDNSIPDPACEPEPRTLGPLLEYRLWLTEVEVEPPE